MYFDFKCEKCDFTQARGYEEVFSIWKKQYDAYSPEEKEGVEPTVNYSCICGHKTEYNSVFFKYIFKLIFDSYLKETES